MRASLGMRQLTTVDRLAKRAAQDETFAGDGPDVTEMAQNEYDQAKTARSGADDLAPLSPEPNPPLCRNSAMNSAVLSSRQPAGSCTRPRSRLKTAALSAERCACVLNAAGDLLHD